jgi:nuclear transport factor 2 (NTF2) superfamily protein
MTAHVTKCLGDLETIMGTIVFQDDTTVQERRPVQIPFDRMTQTDKEHVITIIARDQIRHFTRDYRSREKRKMAIVYYIESNAKNGMRLFENDSTVEDVVVTMARLNGCDLTDQKKMPYVWRINDTDICIFKDGCMTKMLDLSNVKERVMKSLRDIIDLIAGDTNLSEDTIPGLEKIREILAFKKGSTWWHRMNHDQVWERIKTYLPSVTY